MAYQKDDPGRENRADCSAKETIVNATNISVNMQSSFRITGSMALENGEEQ